MPKHMSVKALRHYLSNENVRNCDVIMRDSHGNEYGVMGFSYDPNNDPNTFIISIFKEKYGSVTDAVDDKLRGQ